MRNPLFVLSVLLVGGLAAGCTSPDAQAVVGVVGLEEAAPPVVEPVKTDREAAKAAAQTLRDYAFAQKAEFVVEMNRELVALQVELGRLGTEVDQASGSAKDEARSALKKVQTQWALVMKQLIEVERAPEPTWDETKLGFRKAYGELKETITKSRQWLSKKIEP